MLPGSCKGCSEVCEVWWDNCGLNHVLETRASPSFPHHILTYLHADRSLRRIFRAPISFIMAMRHPTVRGTSLQRPHLGELGHATPPCCTQSRPSLWILCLGFMHWPRKKRLRVLHEDPTSTHLLGGTAHKCSFPAQSHHHLP